jgi:hypothetical protein
MGVASRLYACPPPKLTRWQLIRAPLGGLSPGEHMKENFKHIKHWCLQNQDNISKEQILKSIIGMCDDALAELEAKQPAGGVTIWICDNCKPDYGETFRDFSRCASCGNPRKA